MSFFPTTRLSLLLRIRDTANQAAWEEFVVTYSPAVYRFARRKGLQDADARDIAQNTMVAVASQIGDWKVDNNRARFRTWLSRIALNQTITLFRRHRADVGRGGTSAVAVLEREQIDTSDLELSHRREVFRLLARKVRAEFEEATWQAFWMTAVEGISIEQAARSLGRNVGAIYTARSRIVRRLQELASSYTDEFSNSGPAVEVSDV